MFNLSTQDVVSSIEKTPIINQGNFVYQHYRNFFGETDSFDLDLHIFFMNGKLTKALENKFSTDLKFNSVDYWIDDKDYFLPPHVDNDSIKLSLQIYIGEDHPGTTLYDHNRPIKTFDFKNDSGYAMLLNSSTFHGLEYSVQRNGRKAFMLGISNRCNDR
jgi:hypothetical protein